MVDKIKIREGDMINSSRHEDDDPFIANKDMEAEVVEGGTTADAIQVVIPEIDPDQIFYIHQFEK